MFQRLAPAYQIGARGVGGGDGGEGPRRRRGVAWRRRRPPQPGASAPLAARSGRGRVSPRPPCVGGREISKTNTGCDNREQYTGHSTGPPQWSAPHGAGRAYGAALAPRALWASSGDLGSGGAGWPPLELPNTTKQLHGEFSDFPTAFSSLPLLTSPFACRPLTPWLALGSGVEAMLVWARTFDVATGCSSGQPGGGAFSPSFLLPVTPPCFS